MGTTDKEKRRVAMADGLCMRAGVDREDLAPGARDFAGFTLVEMARECLGMANQSMYGHSLEVVGRALTTSDFPNILANTANKALLEGYETANETWDVWCDVGSVSDFRDHTSNRVSETDDLDEVPEGREYKYGSQADAKETYKVVTYGKILAITRQAIINDDLGAITNSAKAHGEAASRKIGDVAYAVLTSNAAMGDGIALFHSSHANLATAAALAETSIAEMIKLMSLQKDINGKRRLNIRPQYYIAPVALEGSGEVFFNSGQFAGANAAATRTNPYAGSRFTRVYEPRLDDNSATAWYLAGPKGKTVKIFFLGGKREPYLEQRPGWYIDGLEFKVRIDAGAKAMDWRALVKNPGV